MENFDFGVAELNRASKAIALPRVQELMKELSDYNLGVYMPHAHDEQTGQFQKLPHEVVQVERGLVVDFRSRADIDAGHDSAVPVGWMWEDGLGVAAQQYCIVRGEIHVRA